MGWLTQDEDDQSKVKVNGAYNRAGDERTDFLFVDKATGEHSHYSIGSGPDDELVQHHDYQ